MRKKRGKFTTFLCSLIPGAAEMYMGFMKRGISLMTIFILCFVIPSVLRVNDVFILFAVLVWFYSFFHARNLASSSEEAFIALEDTYAWSAFIEGKEIKITNPTLRKWGAVILIVYGMTQLWDVLVDWMHYLLPEHVWKVAYRFINDMPRFAIALIVITVGLKLIAGKKEELNGGEE